MYGSREDWERSVSALPQTAGTSSAVRRPGLELRSYSYLWLVGNGRMVVIVVIIVPHSSIPYEPKASIQTSEPSYRIRTGKID